MLASEGDGIPLLENKINVKRVYDEGVYRHSRPWNETYMYIRSCFPTKYLDYKHFIYIHIYLVEEKRETVAKQWEEMR